MGFVEPFQEDLLPFFFFFASSKAPKHFFVEIEVSSELRPGSCAQDERAQLQADLISLLAPAVGDRGRSRRLVATAMPAQPSHPSAPDAPDIVGWAVLRAVSSAL